MWNKKNHFYMKMIGPPLYKFDELRSCFTEWKVQQEEREMGSIEVANKPHAVFFPMPFQGHVTPFLTLAKLLHYRGFHVTFVNSEFNHQRLLKSRGPNSLDGLPDFRFEAIPDGLPPLDDLEATQDAFGLCEASRNNFLAPFRELLAKLNDSAASGVPPVTCIIADGVCTFTLDASQELGIPNVLFWTVSACGFMGYKQIPQLIERGLTPLKGIYEEEFKF